MGLFTAAYSVELSVVAGMRQAQLLAAMAWWVVPTFFVQVGTVPAQMAVICPMVRVGT